MTVKNSIRILIVDDQELVRVLLSQAMQDEGFRVASAANGEEALLLLGRETFDVVMTDLQLAGPLDGQGFAAAVRLQAPGVPIIFTSGWPEWQHPDGNRFETYIAKPYRAAQVCAAARRLASA